AALVPPVETSSTPSPARVRAASSSPALSDREIRARTGLIASGAGGKSGAAGMGGVRLRLGRGDGGASRTNGTRRPPWAAVAVLPAPDPRVEPEDGERGGAHGECCRCLAHTASS